MKYDKIQQMHEIAERIVSRSEIYGTQYSEHVGECFVRNQVAVVTKGRLGNHIFGSWIPVTLEMYRDESMRSKIEMMALATWRGLAIAKLVPVNFLCGPKGKLPA